MYRLPKLSYTTLRKLLQLIAFLLPSPFNIWVHRMYGAKIGKHVSIHPGVLIIARHVAIGDDTYLRFGTMVNCRSFVIGRKCRLGYFIIIKGLTDMKVGDACVIGPKTMINCDCPVTLGYYCGVGPGCTLFTHGSFLPVTEGNRVTFGPIELKDKSWVTMKSTVGPGVTVESGGVAMPGSIVLESIPAKKTYVGGPAGNKLLPQFKSMKIANDLPGFGKTILSEYMEWSNTYEGTQYTMESDFLKVKGNLLISVNGEGDIKILTESGATAKGMFFNLADLTTDNSRNKEKIKIDDYMRLYYGMTFLEPIH